MAAPVARKRSRSLAATAVAALLLFVLSGCVKLNADFHVDAEEALSGSMQILVDPIALEDMGSTDPSGDLDDAVSEAQADSDVPDGVIVDRVEDEDGYIGMGVTFDRVPASEFQNGGGGLDNVGVEGIEVAHNDGEISFSMVNPLTTGMGSSEPFGSASGMPSSARSMFDEAVVSVSFPGNVISAEGAETNGNTATWNLREYDGDTLSATGDASSFPWGIVLIVGGVLLILIIVAGVIVLVLVLRKKSNNRISDAQRINLEGSGQFQGRSGAGGYPGGPYGPPGYPVPQPRTGTSSFEGDMRFGQPVPRDPRTPSPGAQPAPDPNYSSGGGDLHQQVSGHGKAAPPYGGRPYPAGPNASVNDSRSRFAPPPPGRAGEPTEGTRAEGLLGSDRRSHGDSRS